MDNPQFSHPKKSSATLPLIMAIVVHALLIGALFFGVQWKNSAPVAVEVEMWSGAPAGSPQPQSSQAFQNHVETPKLKPAPPPKVEPAPPPVKADITVKDETKKIAKPKKAEKADVPPKTEPKPPLKAEPSTKGTTPELPPKTDKKQPASRPSDKPPRFDPGQELESELKNMQTQQQKLGAAHGRAENLKALQGEAGLDSKTAAALSKGMEDYASKVRNKIRGNIILPPYKGNPEAVFSLRQAPGGEIVASSIKLKKSSGNEALDQAIERAILKSSPLPKPDPVPFSDVRDLEIKYKPEE